MRWVRRYKLEQSIKRHNRQPVAYKVKKIHIRFMLDEINKNKEASEWFAQITNMVKAELKNSTLIETEAFLNNEKYFENKTTKLFKTNKIKNNVSNN